MDDEDALGLLSCVLGFSAYAMTAHNDIFCKHEHIWFKQGTPATSLRCMRVLGGCMAPGLYAKKVA